MRNFFRTFSFALFFCAAFFGFTRVSASEFSELPPALSKHGAVYYDVPALSQRGLTLEGDPTGVGCVPTCIEMITRYYETERGLQHLEAQKIIDQKALRGQYVRGRGMAAGDAADLLNAAGYHYRYRSNTSKEELLAAFAEFGPLGVMVKTRWDPERQNHSVVMTGWEPLTQQITFNDPYLGVSVTKSWEEFDAIWSLNYGSDPSKPVNRIFYLIYPMSN